MNRFYPFIREELEKTGFPYYPQSDDLKFESGWMAGDLARELVFMLFDDFDYSFLRCSLSCSPRGYMFERSFFLGLPQSCDPKILFQDLERSTLRRRLPFAAYRALDPSPRME